MQKTLSLIITAAVLYYIVQSRWEDNVKETTQTSAINSQSPTNNQTANIVNPNLEGNFIEKTLSKVLINILKTEDGRLFFENILQPMNKPFTGTEHSYKINNTNFLNSLFKINTFGEGKTGPASCGHIVTIHYQILTTNNAVVEEQTRTYTLGTKMIIPGLDSVIVGMMVGQTRQALIPAKYAYYNEKYRKDGMDPDTPYKVNLTLKEILPANFIKEDEVKIFDDEIAYKIPLMCGDYATFDAKITKLSNGTVIFDSEITGTKINMTIGDLNYPLIFSHALFSKIPIGTRTVIIKGKAFQSLGARVSKIFPKEQLPPNEYFMLELKNFQN